MGLKRRVVGARGEALKQAEGRERKEDGMGSVLGFPSVDPSDAAVGARLKRWREQRGWSVEDMARLLLVSAEEARRAEAGRAHLTTAQIGTATHALHLPLWALVSDTRAY